MNHPMFRTRLGRFVAGLVAVGTFGMFGWAQTEPARRARPPHWERLPPGIFFENAFEQGLRGERPARLAADSERNPPTPPTSVATEPATRGRDWAELISATSIEDELKSVKQRCDSALQSEGYFKTQGYREIRAHLGVAAMLFAIIDQYPGPVRWQKSARTARDLFARVAQNTKVGSSQVYREALLRRQDLADLIRGASLTESAADPDLVWPDVADRQLLMQRLEIAVQQSLAKGVASSGELQRQSASLVREAELVAAMAHVLHQEGMADAADDDYAAFCREMQQAAHDLTLALKQEQIEAARQAHGEIKKHCVSCHEAYRA